LSVDQFPGASSPERSSFALSISASLRIRRIEHFALSGKGIVMANGTVKFYNDTKGFGFIAPDEGGNDVFVHASALERSGMRGLAEGQKVSFEVVADRRSGKNAAENIKAL
jgi:CspA family cold shock protein